jgi:large subunit ribosomal protein L10
MKGGKQQTMPNTSKIDSVAEIKDRFSRASSVILADYRGLTVKEMQALRVKLRESGAELRVYKNTLAQIAMRELAMPDLGGLLEGPTAFLFAFGDPVAPAKALVDFTKEHKALEVKGGFIERSITGADGVKALASLPAREELLAKLARSLAMPISSFARVLNAPAGALARALREVAEQKAA